MLLRPHALFGDDPIPQVSTFRDGAVLQGRKDGSGWIVFGGVVNGYERLEIGRMRRNIPILLWQCREKIVFERPRHDDRNGNLLLLYACKIRSTDLSSYTPSGIIAICRLIVSIEDCATGLEIEKKMIMGMKPD